MRIVTFMPLLASTLLAACVSPRSVERQEVVTPQPLVQTYTRHGLESVMGRNARALTALFGQPGLDVREGPGRKLQFLGPACILDAYLYAPTQSGEAVVTHIDARLPDGRDMDRASCVAALTAQQQTR